MTDIETIELMLLSSQTPQKMGSFFVNNATEDFLLIRPSESNKCKGIRGNDEFWRCCFSLTKRNYKNS